jgi:acyl-CoA reductase-like NAD-dependent aldehyde dehydrogenase
MIVSSFEQVDAAIARLNSQKEAWIKVSCRDRIAYLERCIQGVVKVAEVWATEACKAKGIDPESSLAGEEWLAGPVTTLMNLRSLIKTLNANGQRKAAICRRSSYQDGADQVGVDQYVAEVFPDNAMDRLLWLGFKGEVWIEPHQPATQGKIYRQSSNQGRVALVLGAGNIASTPPMDTLCKLFAEDQVVLLKTNPVNDYVGKLLEKAFEPLITDGFFAIVYGGAELGKYVCQHPDIDTIHITGSHVTHDLIVWGNTSEEQKHHKANCQPVTAKPITSELGCVTPILVVPGNWSKSELQFQARHIASMVAHNASFNCAAANVVITAQGWHQHDDFLQQLRQELAKIPPRKAYYPGAYHRYQTFLDRYPHAQVLSPQIEDSVPWTLIPDVPADASEYALQTEAFCGVLAEVGLDVTTADEFLAQAVPFVNEQVWGNLSCVVLVDPRTQKEWALNLQQAIAQLRYGAIGINVWSGVIYAIGDLTWGAFPGNPLDNISSGQGVVHNAYLFDHPQKSVLSAPFRIYPLPFWFANHRNLRRLAQRVVELQANPTWSKFAQVIWEAIKG